LNGKCFTHLRIRGASAVDGLCCWFQVIKFSTNQDNIRTGLRQGARDTTCNARATTSYKSNVIL
jgi:hypothetical protein